MPDGTVIIETKLDASGLKEGLKRAKELAQSAGKSVEKALNGAAKSGADSAGDTAKQTAKGLETMGKSAEKATEGLGQLPGAADAAAGAAGGLGGQMAGLAGTLGIAVTAAGAVKIGIEALKYAVTESHDAFRDFESAMTGVFKTVEGTPEQLAAIEKGIKDMSSELPSSVEEIAAVAEAAGQLGIATDDVLSFSRVMIDLGNSTNLSANDAATALARLSNIMGVQASEYSNLGSAIVGLGNNFATTESEIVSMATRMASTAAVVGLTTPEVLALATAMSSLGIEAEAGGSAASKIFKDIQSAVSDGGGKLEQYAKAASMTAGAFAELWKSSPMDAFQAFINGLAGISAEGGDVIKVLDELEIKEVRMSNAVLSLARGQELLAGALAKSNEEWAANNALAEEAGKRYDTLESKEAAAQNSWKRMWAAFGDRMSPIFKGEADGANWLWSTLADMTEQGTEWAREGNIAGKKIKPLSESPLFDSTESFFRKYTLASLFWEDDSKEVKQHRERMEKAREKMKEEIEGYFGQEVEVAVPLALNFHTETLREKAIAAAEGLQDKLMADLGYTGQRYNSEKGELENYDDSDKWMQKVAANAGQLTTAFGALDTGTKENVLTFEDLLGNLKANGEAMQSWGDDMLDLSTRMGQFDGGDIILEQLRQMGVQGSEQVAAMVAMTDEQLKELADTAARNANIAFTVTMEVEGADAALVELDRQIGAISSQIADYSKLFEGGLISEEQFKELTAPLEAELRALTDAAGLTTAAVTDELDAARAEAEGKVQEFQSVGEEIMAMMAAGVAGNGGLLSDVIAAEIQAAISAAALAAGGKYNPGPEGNGSTGASISAGGMPSTILTDRNGGAVPQPAGGSTTIYNFNTPVYSPGAAAEAERNAATERGYSEYNGAAIGE